MGRAADVEGLQPLVASDAMVDMDDEIALGEARELGEETVRLGALAGGTRHAVAKDVLLGDDGQIIGGESVLEAEHREARGLGRQGLGLGPIRHRLAARQPMVAQHMLQPVAACRR